MQNASHCAQVDGTNCGPQETNTKKKVEHLQNMYILKCAHPVAGLLPHSKDRSAECDTQYGFVYGNTYAVCKTRLAKMTSTRKKMKYT